MNSDEPKDQNEEESSAGFAKISREEFDKVDLEAPIRDSQNVDCWSLANLYETASKEEAKSDNAAAARAYDLVAQVTDMHFKPDDGAEPYGPAFEAPDGRRSMMPGDLRGEQSAVFAAIAPDIGNPGLKARLADVTWLNDRKQSAMATLAIDAYCEAVQAVLDGRSVFLDDNRSASSHDGTDMLARACRIAKATGWKDPEGTRLNELVSDVIRSAFDRKDHNGFHNSAEIGLQFGIGEPSELARNAETLAATKGTDPYILREIWKLAARAYQRSGSDADRNRCLESAAECLVSLADAAKDQGMVASSHLMHAIDDLRRIPNTAERRQQLKLRLRSAQATIHDQMGTISTELDLTELRERARDAVGKVRLAQALAIFAQLARSPTPDELRKEAQKQTEKSPLFSMMPQERVDNDGKVISRSPPLDGSEADEDLALHYRVAQHEGVRRQLVVHGQIHPARQLIHDEHPLEQRDFLPLVAMSQFVPDDRKELFSLAFARFFGGDFISALHILVPQLENSLRHVLKLAGHEPSSIKSDKTQENRSLSVMLKRDRDSLEKIYGPEIVFEIENLFDFDGGPAVRHQVAHGLVSGETCHGADAIYACWFMFRLCCLHVFPNWDELAEWMDGNQNNGTGTAPPEPSDVPEGAIENQEPSTGPAEN